MSRPAFFAAGPSVCVAAAASAHALWGLMLWLGAAWLCLPSAARAEPQAEPRVRGEVLLRTNCARCHAVGRTGDSPRAAAPPFRALSRKYPIESLAEALGQGLSVGHEDMPEFVFPPADVGAILDYLGSIQER
jgi:mono/diheme cytochrome c family protein